MNNLPSNWNRHTVFRDNDYSHTVVFPDEYPLPDVQDIQMQVRHRGNVLTNVTASIVKDGPRVTFTYPSEMLRKIPGLVMQYFVVSGMSILGGELSVMIGVGKQDISESQVTLNGDMITVLEVSGLGIVGGLTQRAESAANKTEQLRDDLYASFGFSDKKSISQIRAASGNQGDFIPVSGGGPGLMAQYNPYDITSLDDGVTVIVSADGKRYNLTTFSKLLMGPLT